MKIVKVIIFSMVLSCIISFSLNCNAVCGIEKNNKYNVVYQTKEKMLSKQEEEEIVKKTMDMVKCIIEGELENFLKLPFYNYNITTDSIDEYSFTKKEIAADFKKKGMVYQQLFDSEKYYKSSQKDIDRRSAEQGYGDYRLCIRDLIIKYKEFSIKSIVVVSTDIVDVYFDWENKKNTDSSKIGYYCGFKLIDNVWYHSTIVLRTIN